MCGICGIIDVEKKLEKDRRITFVENMNHRMIHRGPDGEGYFHDDSISLAMRRLSIIDLHSVYQPLWNKDRTVVVFMNVKPLKITGKNSKKCWTVWIFLI